MPYNSSASAYERRATTVIDATPDGDTVAVAIDVKLDQGIDDYVTDLNHHAANGRHYPATSVASDSRFLKQSPAGEVSWANGVVAADAALKDFSNVAAGAIASDKLASVAPAKIAQDANNRFVTDAEKSTWNGALYDKEDVEGVLTGAITSHAHQNRNLIINGDFRINQRAYVSGTNTTTANQYTLDRWRVVTSGQNVTFSNYLNGRQVTAPAGGIEQVIEDLNIAGGTYVLSWEGTAVGSVNGTVVAKGESFELPAKTHATVKFTGGTVARVQLEAGGVVTPFEERFIGDELALCQRYYEKSYDIETAPSTATTRGSHYSGILTGYLLHSPTVRFMVPKAVLPTVSVFSPENGAVGNLAEYSNSSSFVSNKASVISSVGRCAFSMGIYNGNGTVNNHIRAHWVASAEL